MGEKPNEVFLLYNERESVDIVAKTLLARGIPIYFYRRDVPLGANIAEIEDDQFARAPVILILLGEQGWGPTQMRYAERARAMARPILLALIGSPSAEALTEVSGLFTTYRWIDLRAGAPAYDELVTAIRQHIDNQMRASNFSWRTDALMKTIVDGSDADRAALLERVQRGSIANPEILARRLQTALAEDFSPGRQLEDVAPRVAESLPSIRSWMMSILLALNPEDTVTASLARKHVNERDEPNATVRFWVLAGVWQYATSYHEQLFRQALKDPAADVSGLAAIASDPDSEATLAGFRMSLESMSFDRAWSVLRIMRIYPIPSLAEQVVSLLTSPSADPRLGYDALFALANPEMAQAASPILLERIGLEGLARLILSVGRDVTAIAQRAFARLLLVFDPALVRTTLEQIAADPEQRSAARTLLGEIENFRQEVDEGDPPAPGHANDEIDVRRDSIGIERDVRTLAAVMLARDVKPPLAIGLFGEWGAGKSFYIKSIEAAIKRIIGSGQAGPSGHYCGSVAQIHFNAWHYVDSNLWASLVSHLLDRLSAELRPSETPAEQRAKLSSELVSTQKEIASARREQELATALLESSAKELEKKIAERERRELTLRDFQIGDLADLLAKDPDLKKTVDTALTAVGAPVAIESIDELNGAIEASRTVTGRAAAFVQGILRAPNIAIIIGGIAALIVLPPLIGAGIEKFVSVKFATLTAVATQITIIGASIAGVLGAAVKYANAGLNKLAAAKRDIDKKLAEKREMKSAEEEALQLEVGAARASEKAAIEKVAAATIRAQALETRFAALVDSQSLGYFVTERTRSEDYRRHLGLISTIRKDFDALIGRIGKPKDGERGIERIILYIDDVDRCPPEMVVDILQAVHLLLAYNLFVVVVSVDPRWLLRSLGSKMPQLDGAGSAEDGLSATPRDYLEKIFQIPFTVRPMGARGFARLMDDLLGTASTQGDAAELPAAAVPSLRATAPVDETPSLADVTAADSWEGDEVAIAAPKANDNRTQDDIPAIILAISEVELAFSKQLHELLGTPRAAKRFANIYRILKASVPREAVATFEGTPAVPGDFQLPMLLLAILVGRSATAEALFPRFIEAATSGRTDWWRHGWEGVASPKEVKLARALEDIVGAAYFVSDAKLLVEWLPRVSRFSFGTARLFLEAGGT